MVLCALNLAGGCAAWSKPAKCLTLLLGCNGPSNGPSNAVLNACNWMHCLEKLLTCQLFLAVQTSQCRSQIRLEQRGTCATRTRRQVRRPWRGCRRGLPVSLPKQIVHKRTRACLPKFSRATHHMQASACKPGIAGRKIQHWTRSPMLAHDRALQTGTLAGTQAVADHATTVAHNAAHSLTGSKHCLTKAVHRHVRLQLAAPTVLHGQDSTSTTHPCQKAMGRHPKRAQRPGASTMK